MPHFVAEKNPTIDLTRMTGDHVWRTTPLERYGSRGDELSFEQWVQYAQTQKRTDMSRWAILLQEEGTARARDEWKKFTHRATFFLIPDEISCGRTFARDHLEAYYVDHMARAIKNPRKIAGIHDVPLFNLADPVVGRRWNDFSGFGHRVHEADLRVTEGVMVPHDSHDICLSRVDRLRETFIPTPWWCTERYFPNAVGCPIPPLLFYFTEQYKEGSEEVKEMLRKLLFYEMHLVFAGSWWHLASRGGQGIVLHERMLDDLDRLLQDIPIDADRLYGRNNGQTSFQYILQCMRDVASAPSTFRNVCSFQRYPELQPSEIVWTYDSGKVNLQRRGGRQVFRDPRNLRDADAPYDSYGRKPRICQRVEEEQALHAGPAHAQQPHGQGPPAPHAGMAHAQQPHGRGPSGPHAGMAHAQQPTQSTLGSRRSSDRGIAGNPPLRIQRRHSPPRNSVQNATSGPLYNEYWGPVTASPLNGCGTSRLAPSQWGVNNGEGNRQGRDFRPVARANAQADPPRFNTAPLTRAAHGSLPPLLPPSIASVRQPASMFEPAAPPSPAPSNPQPQHLPLDPIRAAIRDIDMQVGPMSLDEPSGARPPTIPKLRRPVPHGRLRGLTGPSPFAPGFIPRRKSKLKAERLWLIGQLAQSERVRQEAERQGIAVPSAHCRDPQFHPLQRRPDGGGGGNGGGGLSA